MINGAQRPTFPWFVIVEVSLAQKVNGLRFRDPFHIPRGTWYFCSNNTLDKRRMGRIKVHIWLAADNPLSNQEEKYGDTNSLWPERAVGASPGDERCSVVGMATLAWGRSASEGEEMVECIDRWGGHR